MPKNPVRQVFDKRRPFVIFHTHVIDRPVLDAAVAARKSLEVDLSINDKGEVYVGHPPSFYTSQNLPLNNLSLDVILSEMLEPWHENEPNWPEEELPHVEILKLRETTGAPMTLSCHRGLTSESLQADGDVITDKIIETLSGSAEGGKLRFATRSSCTYARYAQVD